MTLQEFSMRQKLPKPWIYNEVRDKIMKVKNDKNRKKLNKIKSTSCDLFAWGSYTIIMGN